MSKKPFTKYSLAKAFGIISWALAVAVLTIGCVHDPVLTDTTDDGNGPSSDTVDFDINTVACEENVIYFENQVLPVFISNCAISGCHDQISAQEGVVLTNYQNIRKGITPGNLNDSEYYEVLITNDAEDLMPRVPNSENGFSLPQDQINTIKSWIEQGAVNNFCNECDTTDYSFSRTISAIISQNCATSPACHGSGSSNRAFTSYSAIKNAADNGLIEQRTIIFKTMPPSGQLPDCEMLLLKKWLDEGALNN